MTDSIRWHTLANGMTLIAESMPSMESAAFSFLVPAGCCYDPPSRLGSSALVCLQELLGVEDEPSQKLMIELRRHRYPDPWGRPSQGDRAGLENSTLGNVREFYEHTYRPNGTIVAVSGNICWEALRDHVEELFADWPARDVAPPTESPRLAPRHHVNYESGQSHIGIAFPTVPYRHADYFQAWAAVGVLSSGMSSRLFTEVREKRGLCYTVSASLQTQLDRARVLCYAGTTAERAQETLDVTMHELRHLFEGVEAGELERLTARIKSSLIMQQESTSARSSALARDWYHLGRARTLDEIGQIIDGLTSDSINDYLAKNPPQDFTVVTLGPEPLEVPVEVS